MEPRDALNRDGGEPQNSPERPKKLFGRGIYGSKDVPIRILDRVILVLIALAVGLTVWNAANGGFYISFDTGGADTAIADQKIRYGQLVTEPETPVRPGYTLDGWNTAPESATANWDFGVDTVSSDMTLYAVWAPASITVKLDLNGGTLVGSTSVDALTVVYGQTYGTLPTPERNGYTFGGWEYSGQTITADTKVSMTGEHILTAVWN